MGAHDHLFRTCFAGLAEAAWLTRRVLPKGPTAVDRLLPTDALAEGIERRPDLAIALREPPRVLLVQHQSTVDATMHLRVALDEALYLRATHSANAPTQEVCTLVVYQGIRPWPTPPKPSFSNNGAYHLLELQKLSEATRRRAPLRARLAIRFLAAAALRNDDAIRACLRTERQDLRRLRREVGPEAVAVFARYVLSTTEKLPREAMMAQIQRIDDEFVEPFVSAYDAILQEGVEQGIAKTLIRIAAGHLPEPTPTQRERIESAPAAQLDAWIDALLHKDPPQSWDALLS